MKYRYFLIIAALFFIASMAVQFVLSYRRTMSNVQDNIDLKTEVAYEKILFELYDAYEVIDLMEQYVANNLKDPNSMLKGTCDLLERYPSFFCLHVDFPENYYPEKGKWFSPCSYRVNDSIISKITGDESFDYFQREWYKGALESDNEGYWSKPYWSDVVDNTLFTHSDNMVDKNGKLVCVIGIDFSTAWMQELVEEFKPFDDAVCLIYSTDGKFITASENMTSQDPAKLLEDGWIVSRKKLETIDIEMVLAVPQWHVWKKIIWSGLWSLLVLISGILVIGIFIRRMLHDQKENARLETEKEVVAHEMQIAHDIQMGILRYDFPQDQDMMMHAGHLPPLVKSADGNVRALNMDRNFPLGFDGNFNYIEDSCQLDEDETLVLYTDGVTEAENAAEGMMGSRRWIEIVSQNDELLEAVKQYIGEAEQSDDITLMTICRKNRYA